MESAPKKLKLDSIVEALFEFQFDHAEAPELIVGQLAASKAWAGFPIQRLPLADLPTMIRESDVAMRYQPILQLSRPESGEIVRVGPHVVSIHILAPYPGWATFEPRLEEATAALFEVCESPHFRRLGLRYINALTADHGIKGISDLNIALSVGGDQLSTELSASYRFNKGVDTTVQVILASPGYVNGEAPEGATSLVDVDVYSASSPGTISAEGVKAWVRAAHEHEKEAFFTLWPAETLAALRED